MADYELGNRDFEIWLALHILFLVNNLARKIANLVEIAMKKKKKNRFIQNELWTLNLAVKLDQEQRTTKSATV